MSAPTIPPAATGDSDDAMRAALLLDELQQAIPLADGQHAELRHLLDGYDLDVALPLPGLPHPKDGGGSRG